MGECAVGLAEAGRSLELSRPDVQVERVVRSLLPLGPLEHHARVARRLGAALEELLRRRTRHAHAQAAQLLVPRKRQTRTRGGCCSPEAAREHPVHGFRDACRARAHDEGDRHVDTRRRRLRRLVLRREHARLVLGLELVARAVVHLARRRLVEDVVGLLQGVELLLGDDLLVGRPPDLLVRVQLQRPLLVRRLQLGAAAKLV
eukprot:5547751-Prymnesium_polylepis.1